MKKHSNLTFSRGYLENKNQIKSTAMYRKKDHFINKTEMKVSFILQTLITMIKYGKFSAF